MWISFDHQDIVVAEAAWKTDETVTAGGLAIMWSTVALLDAVALTSVFVKVVVAYVDCGTAVLIVGCATFSGFATFAARRFNFAVGNRGFCCKEPVDTCCSEFEESEPETSVFGKVVAAYADGGTVVLIAGYVAFSGSATFAARRLSFAVGNRAHLSFAVGIRGLPAALTVALLAAVALTSFYEKVVAASADGRTAVLIDGFTTFFGSATFSARRLNFSVAN
ncbi:hypothetical protein KY290_000696 [Solanum tuberosum]|uniref:Uncharacterized protein n=1 Tax=Solanum tuberosum TaxID=4113 RepID=A0ABQ7WK60_SOLTU|nr:hypothetical protein KY289_000756 [Solanum tuberosum]KAH0781098.1 hypothetical protein KY290_000696 [Solanum tuberosum]